MSKAKGLRTYSKTKKLINQSELLFSELAGNSKEEKAEPILIESTKKPVVEEKKETKKSKTISTKASEDKEKEEPKENIEDEPEKRTLRPKRHASASNLKTATVAAAPTVAKTRKRKNTNDKEDIKKLDENGKEIVDNKRNSNQRVPKLFEMTNSNLEDIEQGEAKSKPPRAARKPRTVKTNKNESNENVSNTSESATATAIINSGLSIDENRAPQPKSIMKHRDNNNNNKKENEDGAAENDEAKAAKPKRGVKILEDTSDKILNVKCNNKYKHTASTSTPSGMRRKPLKAPQDVSMICKPDQEQAVQ